MLELINIKKDYETGDTKVAALKGINLGSGTANLYQYSVSRAVVRQLCLILSEDLISIQVVI